MALGQYQEMSECIYFTGIFLLPTGTGPGTVYIFDNLPIERAIIVRQFEGLIYTSDTGKIVTVISFANDS